MSELPPIVYQLIARNTELDKEAASLIESQQSQNESLVRALENIRDTAEGHIQGIAIQALASLHKNQTSNE